MDVWAILDFIAKRKRLHNDTYIPVDDEPFKWLQLPRVPCMNREPLTKKCVVIAAVHTHTQSHESPCFGGGVASSESMGMGDGGVVVWWWCGVGKRHDRMGWDGNGNGENLLS